MGLLEEQFGLLEEQFGLLEEEKFGLLEEQFGLLEEQFEQLALQFGQIVYCSLLVRLKNKNILKFIEFVSTKTVNFDKKNNSQFGFNQHAG